MNREDRTLRHAHHTETLRTLQQCIDAIEAAEPVVERWASEPLASSAEESKRYTLLIEMRRARDNARTRLEFAKENPELFRLLG